MNTADIKQKLDSLNLTPEVREKIDEILNQTTRGELTEADKEKLAKLIDFDADLNELEANANEEMAMLMTNTADEITRAIQTQQNEQKQVESNVLNETQKMEKELNQVSPGTTV